MWYFIFSTFPPIWKAAVILYLLREHAEALKSATRAAARVYLAALGLGLVGVAGAGLRRYEAPGDAPLPARTVGFWYVWYAAVLAGCARRRDWVLALAACALAWALAQPDVLRVLDLGLADLGATALVYGGHSPGWLALWRRLAFVEKVCRNVAAGAGLG